MWVDLCVWAFLQCYFAAYRTGVGGDNNRESDDTATG